MGAGGENSLRGRSHGPANPWISKPSDRPKTRASSITALPPQGQPFGWSRGGIIVVSWTRVNTTRPYNPARPNANILENRKARPKW
jgi:hypothetical protein